MGWWQEWRKRRREMGRLSPGSANLPPGFGAPVAKKVVPVKTKKVEVVDPHPCDRCGHSHVDGMKIQNAHVEVVINDEQSLFLCRHHYRVHRLHIFERAYEVKEYDTAANK